MGRRRGPQLEPVLATNSSYQPRLRRRSGAAGVVDTEPGCRHGLEPSRLDLDAADLTSTVVTGLEATEGPSHLAKGVLQLDSQDLGLAALGRDLARIGEVGV